MRLKEKLVVPVVHFGNVGKLQKLLIGMGLKMCAFF